MSARALRPAFAWVGRGATAAASFDDKSASDRILAIVGVLVAIGVALVVFTVWYWRSTRPEPEALAPLELLSTRKVRRAAPDTRARALAAVRPGTLAEDGSGVPAPASDLDDLAALAARDLPPLGDLAEPFGPAVRLGPAVEPPPPSPASVHSSGPEPAEVAPVAVDPVEVVPAESVEVVPVEVVPVEVEPEAPVAPASVEVEPEAPAASAPVEAARLEPADRAPIEPATSEPPGAAVVDAEY